ncbi:MAG: MoaD/ThiS family protein [Spirochaetes bacterium]|nr:MoaD/ThiS family protein [Spirochaetota bacterium]
MIITVKAFASVSEICGFRERSADVPEGTSAGAFLDSLVREFPGLAPLRERLLAAVNEEHVPLERLLSEGDTVAYFPPVSGG